VVSQNPTAFCRTLLVYVDVRQDDFDVKARVRVTRSGRERVAGT
jgi:hypothetical protein